MWETLGGSPLCVKIEADFPRNKGQLFQNWNPLFERCEDICVPILEVTLFQTKTVAGPRGGVMFKELRY